MSKLIIASREVALPGDLLAEGMEFIAGKNTYRKNEKIYSNRLGLVDVKGSVIKIIPLSGKYIPQKEDLIVGEISEVGFSSWQVDIGAPFIANLPLSEGTNTYIRKDEDLSKYFNVGDKLIGRILNFTSTGSLQITCKGPGLRKIKGGLIVKIDYNKVPRVIGKKGSMISMIKELTNTEIIVGQNGWVWINGEASDILRAKKAIELINEKGHVKGLTDTIKEMLEKNSKIKPVKN